MFHLNIWSSFPFFSLAGIRRKRNWVFQTCSLPTTHYNDLPPGRHIVVPWPDGTYNLPSECGVYPWDPVGRGEGNPIKCLNHCGCLLSVSWKTHGRVLLTLFAKGQSSHLFRWTSFQFILNVQPCLFGYFLGWWNEASSASQQSTMLTELQLLHQTTCPILPLPAQSTLSEPLLLEPPGVRLWPTSGQSNTHRKHAWPDGKNANKALTWVTQWTKCHVIITPVPTIPPVSSIEPPEGHSCGSSPDL